MKDSIVGRLFVSGLIAALSLVHGRAWGEESAVLDWDAINAAAVEQAKTPIRPGVPGERPFWNGYSMSYIHPPAFDFGDAAGAGPFVFTLKNANNTTVATWQSAHSYDPIDAGVWAGLAPGNYTLSLGGATRSFFRAAVFHGPYASAPRSYGDAALLCGDAIYNLTYVQAWLGTDNPKSITYDLYCYPAKIMGSLIRFLADYSVQKPDRAENSLTIARRAANWMIAHSQGAGTPLESFPPTYSTEACANPRTEARDKAGQHMMLYPAEAAVAYFRLYEVTNETKYRDAALAIARRYVAMQGDDGTWALIYCESDGAEVNSNRLIPTGKVFSMFEEAMKNVESDSDDYKAFQAAHSKAFDYIDRNLLPAWNWEGQFEDQEAVAVPYKNLQHGCAIEFALRLVQRGRVSEACEIVNWCEDQFVFWSVACPAGQYGGWKLPTAVEQYNYYTPIDGSMDMLMQGFKAVGEATSNELYLAKARALADCMVRNQRTDGSIPTYFSANNGSDWLNCMVASLQTLSEMQSIWVGGEEPVGPVEDDNVMYQQSSDGYNESSFVSKANAWKNASGTVVQSSPQRGYEYVCDLPRGAMLLRTPANATAAVTFAGDLLKLVNCCLVVKQPPAARVTIPRLEAATGNGYGGANSCVINYGYESGGCQQLAGTNWLVNADSFLQFTIDQPNRQFDCQANLYGSGEVCLVDVAKFTANDYMMFSGDNRNFTGKVICDVNGSGYVVFKGNNAWPGNPETYDAASVDLAYTNKPTRLVFDGSMALDTPNRAIAMGAAQGTLELTANANASVTNEVKIASPLVGTAGVRLIRKGTGGGQVKFVLAAANADLSGEVTLGAQVVLAIANAQALANCALAFGADDAATIAVELDLDRVGAAGATVGALPGEDGWTLLATGTVAKNAVLLRVRNTTLAEVAMGTPSRVLVNGEAAEVELRQLGADVGLVLKGEQEPGPKVGETKVEPAEVFELARSDKDIVYPSVPELVGTPGVDQKITFGGVTVEVPAYYDATLLDKTVSLALNRNALGKFADGMSGDKPIEVTGDAVQIQLKDVHSGLWYALAGAEALGREDAFAVIPTTWTKAKATTLTLTFVKDGVLRFFRVVASDLEQASP